MIDYDNIYRHLATQAGVVALVGTRIYDVTFPTNWAPPAVTVQRIGTDREYTLTADAGEASASFDIVVWAKTGASAKAVVLQLIAALSGSTALGFGRLMNDIAMYEPTTSTHSRVLEFEFR